MCWYTNYHSFLTNCASPCGFGVIREPDQNVFLITRHIKKTKMLYASCIVHFHTMHSPCTLCRGVFSKNTEAFTISGARNLERRADKKWFDHMSPEDDYCVRQCPLHKRYDSRECIHKRVCACVWVSARVPVWRKVECYLYKSVLLVRGKSSLHLCYHFR